MIIILKTNFLIYIWYVKVVYIALANYVYKNKFGLTLQCKIHKIKLYIIFSKHTLMESTKSRLEAAIQ